MFDYPETGYVERDGVNIGYQVLGTGPLDLLFVPGLGGLARGGEALVSRTVKDLVVGSGIEFEGRGAHELKEVPGEWQLYAAVG